MIKDRLKSLMTHLTHNTVFSDLLKPLMCQLERIRYQADARSFSMHDFLALGVLRHLEGITSLREQVQKLWHLDPAAVDLPPLARSTWSDALSSAKRRDVVAAVIPSLLETAAEVLPDRLADIPGLGDRSVHAIDGTYQKESAHYKRQTPKQGGDDNPKGHALLTFFNIRLGVPEDVYVDTHNHHETLYLREYDRQDHALTQTKKALWLLDRAFIDAALWDRKKSSLGSTMITKMKSNLCYDVTEKRHIDKNNSINEGVVADQIIKLNSSEKPWRLVLFVSRRGNTVKFLTNELVLEPGVIAFLYSRRWEEEKCFDTWKNDFSQAKAWGKSLMSIENQTLMAIITSILIALLIHDKLSLDQAQDQKSLKKQAKRQAKSVQVKDSTDRPDWTVPLFSYTSKVSRQVLRFLKYCLIKQSSPTIYEKQLVPLLERYL